jgi:RNA polymerase sigma factor (sigma-70 family)
MGISEELLNLTDEALVNLFQSTDSEEMRERVFVEIYGRYQRKVEAWAEAACRQGMLSESYIDDVLDTVFFGRLLPYGERMGLLGFRQECSLEVYIRTVTKSCILDESRKRRPQSLDETVEIHGEAVELQAQTGAYRTWVPVSPTPDKTAIRQQSHEILKAALDAVGQGPRKDSWKDASILRAYYWERKTDREIAAELKMSEGAVTVRRHRGHEKLRQILKQEFGIEALDELL